MTRTKTKLVVAGVLVMFPAAVLAAASGNDSSPSDDADGVAGLRESFDLRVPMPPMPVDVDGMPQLVYELHLTNFSPTPLVPERVQVLDARRGTVVAELGGTTLDHSLARPYAASVDTGPRAIAPGMRGVLYFAFAPDQSVLPTALRHRIDFHEVGRNAQQPFVVRGAPVTVNTAQPVVLGAPLRGGPWAAVYDPAWERGHRRVVYAYEGRARIPDRFAIDWVKLDANGRRARGDADVVANWHGYGADVLAVADAVVAATRDDIPESATLSGRLHYEGEDVSGNYVVLDLGDDRYAFYKHLEPASVRVKPGERVQRGEVVASVGFSGHAGGPQLHFHVADANSPSGAAEGLPFAIENFDVLGTYVDVGAFGKEPWAPLDGAMPASRTEELPAPGAVVDFGVGR